MLMSDPNHYSEPEKIYFRNLASRFESDVDSTDVKLQGFARWVPRQALATFMARERIFELIQGIHGVIVECGVHRGAGTFSWAQLSTILEPYNHNRRVVGFDTFSGFPQLSEVDSDRSLDYQKVHGLQGSSLPSLVACAAQYDLNRPLGHLPRIDFVEGDAVTTIPKYVKDNPHLVCALLYLDFDLYEPTKVAIEHFWPRMPVGSVIAFDELNQEQWPGETTALVETIGIDRLRIQRFNFNPQICFAIKE